MRYQEFLKTLPALVTTELPPSLKGIKSRQPYRWLVQFHYGEPWLHYEVARSQGRPGLELGFHCESKDKSLNRYLLLGFRQNLFEIKGTLGETFEAEMWDKGWTKVYEVLDLEEFSSDFQLVVARRMVEIIVCFHPIFVELRGQIQRIYR